MAGKILTVLALMAAAVSTQASVTWVDCPTTTTIVTNNGGFHCGTATSYTSTVSETVNATCNGCAHIVPTTSTRFLGIGPECIPTASTTTVYVDTTTTTYTCISSPGEFKKFKA